MPNPFNSLNPLNPYNANNMSGLRNLYQMMQGGNPMQIFQQMAQRNPQLQPILQALRGGANPQQVFISMCQQRGIDPNQFLTSITGKNTY